MLRRDRVRAAADAARAEITQESASPIAQVQGSTQEAGSADSSKPQAAITAHQGSGGAQPTQQGPPGSSAPGSPSPLVADDLPTVVPGSSKLPDGEAQCVLPEKGGCTAATPLQCCLQPAPSHNPLKACAVQASRPCWLTVRSLIKLRLRWHLP